MKASTMPVSVLQTSSLRLIMLALLCLHAGGLQAQTRDSEPSPTQSVPVQETGSEVTDPAGTPTRTLNGELRLVDEGGQPITGEVDLSEAVVYFNPEVPVAFEPSAEEVLLTTQRRSFVPSVVVIEAGSVVRFPNEDPILHNVFSSSPGNRFDLGLYGKSEGLTHQFDEPGLVRVFCNVHSRMSAHIVVVDTPFHGRPDRDGRFRFDALPQGRGTLTAWHERSDPVQVDVVIGAEAVTLAPIELRATVRQIAPQRERLRRRRRY
jgi:plastocyanin